MPIAGTAAETLAAARQEISSDEEAIRRMSMTSESRRQKMLAQFEHAITMNEFGLPITWIVAKGSKAILEAGGTVDHWVAVEPGADLVCLCGEVLYPGTSNERQTLEWIAEHLKSVKKAAA